MPTSPPPRFQFTLGRLMIVVALAAYGMWLWVTTAAIPVLQAVVVCVLLAGPASALAVACIAVVFGRLATPDDNPPLPPGAAPNATTASLPDRHLAVDELEKVSLPGSNKGT